MSATLIALLIIYQIHNLYYYVENTNRKLTRFLEYIKYSDFASGFAADNRLGKSFRELNDAFNEVLEAFREARSEKEEHLQYLNTVVKHVGIGLISFDTDGKIELLNPAACRLLFISNILTLNELADMHPELTEIIRDLVPGGSSLFRNNEKQLAIQATEIRLRGKSFKLISLQNIQNELQQKELEAWQNLTSVLRHEIMNSIAPISSLVSTLNDIFEEELPENYQDQEFVEINNEIVDDIREALSTIDRRSKGLIKFINAYKEFTHIPKPKFKLVSVKDLIENIVQLLRNDLKQKQIQFDYHIDQPGIKVSIDPELIEMVLINLIKNAAQAVNGKENPTVQLISKVDENQHVTILVIDNGPGIIPEAIDQIFIPFYTTKKDGSGIGLSLSRQIMQLHKGSLTVHSNLNERTEFKLTF
ncbi:sensor histidine kinase [Chondrinema litorale]|uniref:sensor histidine kinase n=1 Tax=Chondrinema litorale TaxID=2994555 RepID=UPI0025436934|nr:ATP-binding protein [Chondrinema litorale]UZR94656.1 ATP-binding protein [Chondrinema litorale]